MTTISCSHAAVCRSLGFLLLTVCCAPAAVFIPNAARADDDEWRGDIQYLTWDVRADEAEAAAAANSDGEVYLQPSDEKCDCNACDSCGYGGCDYCEAGMVSGWQSRMMCLCKQMEASGINYDFAATQFYQGVTSGGIDEGFEYGGKIDQFVTLDSGKLGLWQGMTMTMHAETRFGRDVNFNAVGLAPVNVAMLYPKFNEHDTAITGLSFAQALDEEVLMTFGKFNALDLFYMLYPQTGRGVSGFMNASMVVPLSVARVVPLSFMGAGALKLHGKQVQGGVLVYDPHNIPTTSGFDELGDNGANIFGFWRFFTELGGLPGSHLFGFSGATGEFAALDPEGFVIVPGQGIVAPRQNGSWAAIYILEQRLWADCCNPARNIGLLSQWSIADEHTSPFQWTGNVAIQGTGLVAGRPQDSAGVGYFYTGLSNEFQSLLNPVLDLHDLHGVELYYNAALAKCFALTADLQVIEPAETALDTAVVFGLRGTIAL